tara:strand:+ start:265 stop:471 length:207 start_codon:yes stop_codon:yes gene_type:complete
MTPKEKAEQLFQLYLPFVESGHIEEIKNRCKRCALITLLEIIKVVKVYNDTQAEYTYWKEVKNEIEKL